MNDLDEIIVTVAKSLLSSGIIAEGSEDELIPLAITVTEKLVSKGYAKLTDFSVDVFDDLWFQSIYDAVYEVPSLATSVEPLPEDELLELEPEQPTYEGGSSFESPYDDEDLELFSGDEVPAVEELLDAPAAPKIRYPERAERKILNPKRAEANAPSWATLKPKN